MQLIYRHIRSTVVSATVMVMLVLLGIQSFMELIGQLSVIGKANYGLLQALVYVPLQLPADLYQLFPMAGFLGSLIGLGRLASNSELIVMRSAGVSIRQILWSVIKTALWMILIVTIIGEAVAPILQNKAEEYKAVALHRDANWKKLSGLWLRHDNQFVYIAMLDSPEKISKITLYNFNKKHQLLYIDYAKNGELLHGKWLLNHITRTIWSNKNVLNKKTKQMPLGFLFNPQL